MSDSDALVESLVHSICLQKLALKDLRVAIVNNLSCEEITDADVDHPADEKTQEVWGNTQQMVLMRDMRMTLYLEIYKEAPLALNLLDDRVAQAERGPLLFNVILTMYRLWSQRWREENGHADDSEEDEDMEVDSEASDSEASDSEESDSNDSDSMASSYSENLDSHASGPQSVRPGTKKVRAAPPSRGRVVEMWLEQMKGLSL